MSSLTRKKACKSSISHPSVERSRFSSGVRGRWRICKAVSGTERPLLSFPPGVLAFRDYFVSFLDMLTTVKLTFWNHSSALEGILYLVAAVDKLSTSDGQIDSKSAREVLSAMLGTQNAINAYHNFTAAP